MINPGDIATILSAAAPIVASITNGVSTSIVNKSDLNKNNNQEKTVNITINNHFHTKTESESVLAASELQNKIVETAVKTPDNTRYII